MKKDNLVKRVALLREACMEILSVKIMRSMNGPFALASCPMLLDGDKRKTMVKDVLEFQ